MSGGKKNWYFSDGYLPVKDLDSRVEAHEALMLLNTLEQEARILIDIYFSDRPPAKNIPVVVPPERIISLRLDRPEDLAGTVIPPVTQYALRIRSDSNVVAQFGRIDTTQTNMSYYVGVGYCE